MNREEEPRAATGAKKKRILVVDDDSSVREVLAHVLFDEGYLALTAADGPQALEIAAKTQIDLVLLDLNMPGQSGWETLQQLATDNPLLAVIIVTARPGQLFKALGAGVGALLEKPLDYEKMLQTMRTLLDESPQVRLARRAGHRADFHYLASCAGPSRPGWRPN